MTSDEVSLCLWKFTPPLLQVVANLSNLLQTYWHYALCKHFWQCKGILLSFACLSFWFPTQSTHAGSFTGITVLVQLSSITGGVSHTDKPSGSFQQVHWHNCVRVVPGYWGRINPHFKKLSSIYLYSETLTVSQERWSLCLSLLCTQANHVHTLLKHGVSTQQVDILPCSSRDTGSTWTVYLPSELVTVHGTK